MATYYELQEPEFHTAIRGGTLGEMLGYLEGGVELELWKVSRRRVKRRMIATHNADGTWTVEEAPGS